MSSVLVLGLIYWKYLSKSIVYLFCFFVFFSACAGFSLENWHLFVLVRDCELMISSVKWNFLQSGNKNHGILRPGCWTSGWLRIHVCISFNPWVRASSQAELVSHTFFCHTSYGIKYHKYILGLFQLETSVAQEHRQLLTEILVYNPMEYYVVKKMHIWVVLTAVNVCSVLVSNGQWTRTCLRSTDWEQQLPVESLRAHP